MGPPGAAPRPDPTFVTVYKHSDGYPDGAVCWITKSLEHAWPVPGFEADEFAAAFVAANKPSAKTQRMDYIAKAQRETDPERRQPRLRARRPLCRLCRRWRAPHNAEGPQDAAADNKGWTESLWHRRFRIDAYERCRHRGGTVDGRFVSLFRQ